MTQSDDDAMSLAIFICQELGFVWANRGHDTPTQDDFIELARKIIDLKTTE